VLGQNRSPQIYSGDYLRLFRACSLASGRTSFASSPSHIGRAPGLLKPWHFRVTIRSDPRPRPRRPSRRVASPLSMHPIRPFIPHDDTDWLSHTGLLRARTDRYRRPFFSCAVRMGSSRSSTRTSSCCQEIRRGIARSRNGFERISWRHAHNGRLKTAEYNALTSDDSRQVCNSKKPRREASWSPIRKSGKRLSRLNNRGERSTRRTSRT